MAFEPIPTVPTPKLDYQTNGLRLIERMGPMQFDPATDTARLEIILNDADYPLRTPHVMTVVIDKYTILRLHRDYVNNLMRTVDEGDSE